MRRILIIGLFVAGCTALTPFDPESQPCELNAPPGEQCITGYACVATTNDGGICKHFGGGETDAGGGVDAGQIDAGGFDAGAVDSGVDAGPRDAGSADSGM